MVQLSHSVGKALPRVLARLRAGIIAKVETIDSHGSYSAWEITDASSITVGADSASEIINSGLFEKLGYGEALISPLFVNDGQIKVVSQLFGSANELDFQGAVRGTGSALLVQQSTLEFDSSVASTQTVSFSGGGGDLVLHDPTAFKASIADFDAGGAYNDSISLLQDWTLGAYQANGAGGTLTLTDGSATATLNFVGQYQGDRFHAAFSGGVTTLTYT